MFPICLVRWTTQLLALPPLQMVQAAQSCARSMGKQGTFAHLPPTSPGTSSWAGSLLETHPSKPLPRWAGNPEALDQKAHQEMMLDPLKLWEWWLLSCGIPAEPCAQLLPSHGYHCRAAPGFPPSSTLPETWSINRYSLLLQHFSVRKSPRVRLPGTSLSGSKSISERPTRQAGEMDQ